MHDAAVTPFDRPRPARAERGSVATGRLDGRAVA
jgi:hypothetical protein